MVQGNEITLFSNSIVGFELRGSYIAYCSSMSGDLALSLEGPKIRRDPEIFRAKF